ncbi:hypothetical protein AcW1_003584 [Taiwanofungus camphoratus]|nr:hypothetical protein AcW1_003584 [Antrodia cinnamomea]
MQSRQGAKSSANKKSKRDIHCREAEEPVWRDNVAVKVKVEDGLGDKSQLVSPLSLITNFISTFSCSSHANCWTSCQLTDIDGTIDFTTADTDDERFDDIEIVWPEKGGILSLNSQKPHVQDVLRAGISKVLIDICFNHAFPESLKQKFMGNALIDCAEALGYKDIKKRLCNDRDYNKELSNLPAQRVSSTCYEIKQKTDAMVDGYYGCMKPGRHSTVEWLLKFLHFIYPCDAEKQTIDSIKPFQHPAIIAGLQQCFFSGLKSFGHKNINLFTTSDPERPDEKEIPMAMLGLVTTAIFASLMQWSSTEKMKVNFGADAFIGVYEEAIAFLTAIKTQGPRQYHTMMRRLFDTASGSTDARKPQKSTAAESLAILDLTGMDVD